MKRSQLECWLFLWAFPTSVGRAILASLTEPVVSGPKGSLSLTRFIIYLNCYWLHVYNNKKFLILPLGKDQIDNALRLRKYGIDNMVPIESITPKVLIDAIVNLESERKTLQNLEKLSKVFQSVERESPSTQVLLSNLT